MLGTAVLGDEIKKNGNVALAEHGIEITKKGRSDILDEVGGLHEVETKKNGSLAWAGHGTWQIMELRSTMMAIPN